MKFVIVISFLLIVSGSKAQSSHIDSMIVRHIVVKCNLADSISKKLTDHFRKYSNAIRLCKITNDHYGKFVKERDEGILTIFGKNVYDEYLIIKKKLRQSLTDQR